MYLNDHVSDGWREAEMVVPVYIKYHHQGMLIVIVRRINCNEER